jgi:hypothetical protein
MNAHVHEKTKPMYMYMCFFYEVCVVNDFCTRFILKYVKFF